ncbi:PREDICTED: uncharacterized protein LOC108365917 isoform X3 [Rhagoletis zephyria]|uniref:uncharacterized protein LOC108365917 isoform X3 n=1 Tax=Rhagoletis zephyria TaxID=28612 RepID=UPI0008117645|nr:PREDICTED: uncharacterized protein LOC108365917 isoform X3 [Rhagoletis zephyria]
MNTKMPRTSEKQKIINFLIEQAAFDILLQDDEASFWEIMENLNEELIITLSNYRGSFQQVPKSLEWRTTILPQLDEYRFQQMLRVTRDQFTFILSLIRNNIEFNKSHSVRQYSVDHQLAIVLFRLGSSGENAAIRKIASVFGVGDGETIYKITKRVFQAFLELKSKYIYWPDAAATLYRIRTPSHDVDYMYNVLEDDEELDELTMNEIGQNSSQAESKRSYLCALMLGD